MRRFVKILVFLAGLCMFALPGFSEENRGIKIESFSVEDFISHFQTVDGNAVDFPEIALKGVVRISPRMLFDIRHYRGTSRRVNGFQASVGDFEWRAAYRLGEDHETMINDSPLQNVYAWLSWKIWTSTVLLNGQTTYERDEGLGIGITRYPSKKGLSYYYEASLYPTVRESEFHHVRHNYLAAAGAVYNMNALQFTLGYRLQTLSTDEIPSEQRAQEQGAIFGLRGNF